MNLKDLVDNGLVLGAIQDGLEILYAKIANADALQFAFVLERLKNLPQGLQFAWGSDERVVDEEKIGDKTELFDRGFDGLADFIEGHFTSNFFFRECIR